MIKANLIALKTKNNIISGKIYLELSTKQHVEINKLVLTKRNSLSKEEIKVPIRSEKIDGEYFAYFKLDVNTIKWKPYYWDAFIEVKNSDEFHLIRIKVINNRLKIKMNIMPFIKSVNIDPGYHLFPYITFFGSFSLTYKPKMYYESKHYQWKWIFAFFIYYLFKPYWKSKKIWIGFEKNSIRAQDNGFAFFQYCYENQKYPNFYYVIQKFSPDIRNLKGMEKKLLKFMSFKYMVYLLASKLLISSESKGHIYDIRIQGGLVRWVINRKKHIFLQHGVIGLKKVDNIFHHNSNNKVDLFITSSEFEKNIITTHFGYQENVVEVTGLSRWDKLKDTSNGRKILVMPTWRPWIDDISNEEFVLTNYYQTYMKMITSDDLVKIVEENNLYVTFFLHPKFTQYTHLFKSLNKRVMVLSDGSFPVQKEIENAALMVTDFSSVAWDMFYLGKPVIFFQFDYKDYLKQLGSYLDFSTDLFGDIAENLNELYYLLAEYAKNGFQEKEVFKNKRNYYFAYNDTRNNERIFNTIINHLPRLYKKEYGIGKMIVKNIKILNKISMIINKSFKNKRKAI